MKIHTVVALILGCTLWTLAQACEIEDKRPVKLGADEGVTGRCPNSGSKVTCIYQEGEGWTCEGPEGSYTGASEATAAASACGCQ